MSIGSTSEFKPLPKSIPAMVAEIIDKTYETSLQDNTTLSVIDLSVSYFASLSATWDSYPPNSSKPWPGKDETQYNTTAELLKDMPRPLDSTPLNSKFLLEFIIETITTATREIQHQMESTKEKLLKRHSGITFIGTMDQMQFSVTYTDGAMVYKKEFPNLLIKA